VAGTLRHLAPMTMGADGSFGHGPTVAVCGVEIQDITVDPLADYHSNVWLHVTCGECLRLTPAEVAKLPDLGDLVAVERWLSTP
jgi:hypothetical protein